MGAADDVTAEHHAVEEPLWAYMVGGSFLLFVYLLALLEILGILTSLYLILIRLDSWYSRHLLRHGMELGAATSDYVIRSQTVW